MSAAIWRTTSLLLRSFLRSESCIKYPIILQNRLVYERARFISYSISTRTATSFTTSRKHAPYQSSTIIYLPTEKALEEAELEVDVIPIKDARINITDAAAEQLKSIAEKDGDNNSSLRISVHSGGCHGYQYALELTSERQPDDYHLCHPNIKPCNIVIDAVSMPLLKGCTLDFATELIGSTFRVVDNPQAKLGGCGCGISWDLKT